MEQKRLGSTKIAKLVPRDISENLGKLPPQALDLEEAVLGAIIVEKNAMIEVAGFLRPAHFYTEQHVEIYRAIQLLFAAAAPIDMRTVVKSLRETGKLEIVGGAYYIAELASRVSSSANLEYHARILVEYAMRRAMITMGSNVQNTAYDETIDVFDQVDQANLELQEILDDAIGSKSETSIKDIAVKVVKDVEARQSGKHTGLDSGFSVLDAILNGFQPTDLLILAARPGVGKSALAVQAAKQIAERGEPVGIVSMEMSANQLVERLITAECEIMSDIVKKGKMADHEIVMFMHASGKISQLPIHVDDTPFMTILELRARAMRMKTKYGIKLLVVDYLQLIKGSGKQGQNRDQEIGEITRTLKGMAKELEIPIIALSQLNRSVETRGGDKRPLLSDLRESGSIEQDADVVLFLYRPEYYKITQDEDGNPTHGKCEVIVAKHRAGALDTVVLKFIGKYTKFAKWEFESSGGRMADQSQYIKQHVKDVLPSERTAEDFNPEKPF